jgi:hypothetical protein
MSDENFFRNTGLEETLFFDEGPRTLTSRTNQFITGTFPVATWAAGTPQHSVFPLSSDGQSTNKAQRVRLNVRAKQAQGEVLAFEVAHVTSSWFAIAASDDSTVFVPQDDGSSTSFTFDVTTWQYFRVRLAEAFPSSSKGDISLSLISGTFNLGGIDTSAIDGYRQGVELTQQKHFDAGLVKIHAGEPGHILRKNSFGMGKNYKADAIFEELDYFNPVNFILAQELAEPLLLNILTFPIITGDNDQIENFIFDGIIEPLPIREVSSFFSTEVPFQARTTRGTFMGGNSDQTWSSDQVLTVDYFEPEKHQIEFVDMVDMIDVFRGSINNIVTSSTLPITVTGIPKGLYTFTGVITYAGALGARGSSPYWKYTLDGTSYSDEQAISGTMVIPDTGLTITFTSPAAYNLGNYIQFDTSPLVVFH